MACDRGVTLDSRLPTQCAITRELVSKTGDTAVARNAGAWAGGAMSADN
jgi:hypothetical protein